MKKRKICHSFLYATFIIPWIMSQSMADGVKNESDAEKLYAKVKNKYQSIQTYYSKIKCEVSITDDKSISMRGLICLESPDKWLLRLNSDNSKKNRIILFKMSNGGYTWDLDNRRNTIIKKKYSQEKSSKNPIAGRFFPAFNQFDEKDISLLNETSEAQTLKVMLSEKRSAFNHVRLVIDKKTDYILKMSFYTVNDKFKMAIVFENPRINQKLSDKTFGIEALPSLKIEEQKGKE